MGKRVGESVGVLVASGSGMKSMLGAKVGAPVGTSDVVILSFGCLTCKKCSQVKFESFSVPKYGKRQVFYFGLMRYFATACVSYACLSMFRHTHNVTLCSPCV